MKNQEQNKISSNTLLAAVIRPLRNEEALQLLKNNTPIEISSTKTKWFREWVEKKIPTAYFLAEPSKENYGWDVLTNYSS
jgi:hypothetical protein